MFGFNKRRFVSYVVAFGIAISPTAVATATTDSLGYSYAHLQESQVRVVQTPETVGESPELDAKPLGARGFLIKQGLRLVSSMLRSGKVSEVVEAARRRDFIDDDMARAISSRPNQIADAIDNTLREAGDFEEGIKEKLRVNLEPVVGDRLALGISEALMFVFL